MLCTTIENSQIRVSRLGFGTASLHHIFSAPQRQRVLHAAAMGGLTHFDTSPYYGYGLAESDLGTFLRKRRQDFTVTTKVGLYPWGPASRNATSVWARKLIGKIIPSFSLPVINWHVNCARASLVDSLRRLGTDYVDFLLLHEPEMALLNTDEFLAWLESVHISGIVRSWGVAGVADRVAPFVLAKHPLASVVQTYDSLDKRQAEFMLNNGRNLQFTYGYLSALRHPGQAETPTDIMHKALQRNTSGAIIISSRCVEHVTQLAKVAVLEGSQKFL